MTATACCFGFPWPVAPPAAASAAAPAARPANHFAFIPATSSNRGNIGPEHQTDKLPPIGAGVAVTRVTRGRFTGTWRDSCTSVTELAQLFEELALAGRQLAGELHLEGREGVALPSPRLELRQAIAAQPEGLSRGATGRDLDPDGTFERRHRGLPAEHGGRERDLHRRQQVVALPLERRMRLETDAEVEVAPLPSAARCA